MRRVIGLSVAALLTVGALLAQEGGGGYKIRRFFMGTSDYCGPPLFPDFLTTHPKQSILLPDLGMTDASLEYLQLLAQSEILQGDLFMPPNIKKIIRKTVQDSVQHSAKSVSASLIKNQPSTRQMAFWRGRQPAGQARSGHTLSRCGTLDSSQPHESDPPCRSDGIEFSVIGCRKKSGFMLPQS